MRGLKLGAGVGSLSGSEGADSFVLCGLLGSFGGIVFFEVAGGWAAAWLSGVRAGFPGVGSCPMLGSVRSAKTVFEKTPFCVRRAILRAMRRWSVCLAGRVLRE